MFSLRCVFPNPDKIGTFRFAQFLAMSRIRFFDIDFLKTPKISCRNKYILYFQYMRYGSRKIFILMFLLAVFATLLVSCGQNQREKKSQVAVVGGDGLSAEDLMRKVPPEFKDFITRRQWLQLVHNWVDEKLLSSYALSRGAKNDPDVQRKLEDARRQILEQYLRDKIIAPKIEISKYEIEQYYGEHIADFIREHDEIEALHIVVQSKVLSDSVKKFLKSDSSFCWVAKKFSEEYSPQDSCYLGWFSRSDILPDLVRPVFKSKPGDTVGPIKAGGNYHFFYIISYGESGTPRSLDEVRETIRQKIFQSKFDNYMSNLLDSLRAVAKIKIDTAAIDSISLINRANQKNISQSKKQIIDSINSETIDSSNSMK